MQPNSYFTMSTKGSDSVAIFWDYESCPVPSNASGYSIANKVCTLASSYGIVRLFKAYLEIPDQLRSITLRSELQSSGVSLVDCPHNGRKGVADKMLLVDMLAYAIDSPAPSTIILITGDRDFAYALAILKRRRYHVVLVAPPDAHANILHQASVCFDWFKDVINLDSSYSQHTDKAQKARTSHSTSCDGSTDKENDCKQAQRDILPEYVSVGYPSYSTNSKSIPFQTTSQAINTTPSLPQPSHHRELQSNIMKSAIMFGNISSTFSQTNGLSRDPDRNSQHEESNLPSNKPLIDQVGVAIMRPRPPSPPTFEASSLSKSSSEETDDMLEIRPLIVPPKYRSLVEILRAHRRKGIFHSYRSVIAAKIAKSQLYRRAGVDTFAEFMDLAERDGMVELGGSTTSAKGAWIRLLPDWYDPCDRLEWD